RARHGPPARAHAERRTPTERELRERAAGPRAEGSGPDARARRARAPRERPPQSLGRALTRRGPFGIAPRPARLLVGRWHRGRLGPALCVGGPRVGAEPHATDSDAPRGGREPRIGR